MSAIPIFDIPGTLQTALELHQQGDLTAAARIYDDVLHQQPNANAYHLRGLIEHHRGRPETAIPLIQQALRLEPDSSMIYNNLGAAQLAHGDLAAAEASFRQACLQPTAFPSAWSNLAIILLKRNRPGEALLVLQHALERTAGTAGIYHQLGIARERCGKLELAEAAYRESLQINPQQPVVYNDLGSVLIRRERLEAAAQAFRQACTLDSQMASAWSNLGTTLHRLHQRTEAIAALERAIEIQPQFAGAHFNLANLLSEQGQTSEAIKHLQAAVERKPDNPDFLLNLAAAHNSQGQFGEAVSYYRRIIQQNPRQARAYYGLITFNPQAVTESEVQQLQQMLEQNQLSEEEQVGAYFGLGKRYDEQQNYERAFYYYEQGNLRVKRRKQFDADRLHRVVDQTMEVYSAEFFARQQNYGSNSTQPVFILGMPRSGSTLVDQILTSHSQVKGAGEFAGIRVLLDQFLDIPAPSARRSRSQVYPYNVRELTAAQWHEMATCYLQLLQQTAGSARKITDKLPSNAFQIGLIATLFPRATIIYTKRNPLDIGLSCYFQNFTTSHEFSFDLRNIGRFYREHERLMQHWFNVCPLPIHVIEYETLVQQQEQQTRRLIEQICGLPWEEQCLQFQKNPRAVQTASLWQVRQPLYDKSVDKWKHYAGHLAPLIEELELQLLPAA